MNWHNLSIEHVNELTGSSAGGLSSAEAAARLTKYGFNQLQEGKKKSILLLILKQFSDLMILILLAAAIISGIIGDLTDTFVILGIVMINAVIGFLQEYRADQAMEALKRMAVTHAHVKRDGIVTLKNARELVPGDLVLLESGSAVPADMRLLEVHSLQIDESALTGESFPIEKYGDTLNIPDVPLNDRTNMAFKGTFVTYGRGAGLVIGTGMNTEIGRIASLLQQKEPPTPLQLRLTAFGKRLSTIILSLCAVFLVTGWLRGEGLVKMILTSVSLAVAAIPEAMPAVVTISLALAARRLVKAKSLVRNLHAVETLGSVTYICTDKTGTLTRNRMTVDELYAGGREIQVADLLMGQVIPDDDIQLLVNCLVLNNDAEPDAAGVPVGDPTEVALMEAAMGLGLKPGFLPRVAEIPFEGGRKMMTTFHPWGDHYISITKGAPEILATRCINVSEVAIGQELDHVAGKGQRVLGFAYRSWQALPGRWDPDHIENGLHFIGMAGLIDPPREEVSEAVKLCKTAGIVPVIITGDHPLTAKNIAIRTGIMEAETDRVISGRELEAMSESEYRAIISQVKVYARVTPEQKLRIITALQEKGHFVAMAGDGTNDAPSLKRANIGVAMGITGTDVSKEASDLILLDDNFSTIVRAVREGRRIYDNILKFIKYLMTTNSSEIWTLMMAPLIGLPIPLLPIHILWVNLVSDGLPAVSLSFEKAEPDIMNRKPRDPGESVFANGRALHILWVGILMAGVVLSIQSWSLRMGLHWQTMTFTVLSLTQLTHLLVVRSEKRSLFRMGLFSNRILFISFILSLALQLAVVYVPALNPVFKTVPLNGQELGICFLGAGVILAAVETEKWIKRKRNRNK